MFSECCPWSVSKTCWTSALTFCRPWKSTVYCCSLFSTSFSWFPIQADLHLPPQHCFLPTISCWGGLCCRAFWKPRQITPTFPFILSFPDIPRTVVGWQSGGMDSVEFPVKPSAAFQEFKLGKCRIIESLRLRKKNIKNYQVQPLANPTKANKLFHPLIFWAPPGMTILPVSWAACFSPHPPLQWRNIPKNPTRTSRGAIWGRFSRRKQSLAWKCSLVPDEWPFLLVKQNLMVWIKEIIFFEKIRSWSGFCESRHT